MQSRPSGDTGAEVGRVGRTGKGILRGQEGRGRSSWGVRIVGGAERRGGGGLLCVSYTENGAV